MPATKIDPEAVLIMIAPLSEIVCSSKRTKLASKKRQTGSRRPVSTCRSCATPLDYRKDVAHRYDYCSTSDESSSDVDDSCTSELGREEQERRTRSEICSSDNSDNVDEAEEESEETGDSEEASCECTDPEIIILDEESIVDSDAEEAFSGEDISEESDAEEVDRLEEDAIEFDSEDYSDVDREEQVSYDEDDEENSESPEDDNNVQSDYDSEEDDTEGDCDDDGYDDSGSCDDNR